MSEEAQSSTYQRIELMKSAFPTHLISIYYHIDGFTVEMLKNRIIKARQNSDIKSKGWFCCRFRFLN